MSYFILALIFVLGFSFFAWADRWPGHRPKAAHDQLLVGSATKDLAEPADSSADAGPPVADGDLD